MEAILARYEVTNSAAGPRSITTATGGITVPRGESRVIELSDNDVKGLKAYTDNGDLSIKQTSDAESPIRTIPGVPAPTPASEGAEVVTANGESKPPEDVTPADAVPFRDPNDPQSNPTAVKHLGFGRWYGLNGEEKVTEAMTRAEAEAYAAEHSLVVGEEADPSKEPGADDKPPEEQTTPPDNT